jgi:hypothetical protein
MTFYQAIQAIYGQTFVNTVLAAFKTVPGGALVTAGKLRLSNLQTFNPTPANTISDFSANECAYSGYTAGGIAVVLTAPVNLSTIVDGVMFTALFEATSASPFVPDTAYGWWIDDGTNVIAAERFANNGAAGFGAPGAFLNLTAILPMRLMQPTA